MIETTRSLNVLADEGHFHLVEAFVEKICDDYNIFNSYFGILLFSVTETFRKIVSISKKNAALTLNLRFIARAKSLYFQFHMGEKVYELAELINTVKHRQETVDEELTEMDVIYMLSDHFHLDAEKGFLEIGFSVGSINNHLVLERSAALGHYYSILNPTKKV